MQKIIWLTKKEVVLSYLRMELSFPPTPVCLAVISIAHLRDGDGQGTSKSGSKCLD